MKEHLSALVQAADPSHARNLAREYLQARILAALQAAGAMMPLAFHGGTALRFLFAIQRYSAIPSPNSLRWRSIYPEYIPQTEYTADYPEGN